VVVRSNNVKPTGLSRPSRVTRDWSAKHLGCGQWRDFEPPPFSVAYWCAPRRRNSREPNAGFLLDAGMGKDGHPISAALRRGSPLRCRSLDWRGDDTLAAVHCGRAQQRAILFQNCPRNYELPQPPSTRNAGLPMEARITWTSWSAKGPSQANGRGFRHSLHLVKAHAGCCLASCGSVRHRSCRIADKSNPLPLLRCGITESAIFKLKLGRLQTRTCPRVFYYNPGLYIEGMSL
jgi:hypothetical protein